MLRRKKVVICAYYRQFVDWCRENNVPPSQAIYADSREKILGLELKKEDIVYTGTPPENLHLIERELLLRIR